MATGRTNPLFALTICTLNNGWYFGTTVITSQTNVKFWLIVITTIRANVFFINSFSAANISFSFITLQTLWVSILHNTLTISTLILTPEVDGFRHSFTTTHISSATLVLAEIFQYWRTCTKNTSSVTKKFFHTHHRLSQSRKTILYDAQSEHWRIKYHNTSE